MRNTFTPVCQGRAPRPKTKQTLSEIVVRKYSLVFFRLSTASLFPWRRLCVLLWPTAFRRVY